MKNSGTCPKCHSTEIYNNQGFTNRGDRCLIPVTSWMGFYVSVYVCLNCGYVEEYMTESDLQNQKKMDKIRAEWKKEK